MSAVVQLDDTVRARAISFLRWQAGARNEPGPTVYHELGIACILASLFRDHPGARLRDALNAQCARVLETADRELLEAIETRDIYNINWPLDITLSMREREWRQLCGEMLGPFREREMPASAAAILRRLDAGS